MCDLKSKSKLKKVKVYKVCYGYNGHYFAVFSGMEIKTGNVKDMQHFEMINGKRFYNSAESPKHPLHNPLAIGRTTGFKSKKIADRLRFAKQIRSRNEVVVLELELSNDIVRGTGEKIMRDAAISKSIVYAGKTVVSFKKVESALSAADKDVIMENMRISREIANQKYLEGRKRREEKRKLYQVRKRNLIIGTHKS